jgi:hypothetical protein
VARALADIRSLARRHTSLAINTLAGVARNSENDSARVAAAAHLLDRGWGKPGQDVSVSADIRITIRKMLGEEDELIDVTPNQEPKKIEQEG